MSNTLGDSLYDIIQDAIRDVVREADNREEELEEKIYALEQENTSLLERINELLDEKEAKM